MEIDQNAPVITRDEILIDAPLDIVWNLLTDITGWVNWNKGIESTSLSVPLAVGVTFQWFAGGLQINSTVRELISRQRIMWAAKVNGIFGFHSWQFTIIGNQVLVQTEESWDGEKVRKYAGPTQQLLDESIRSWLESLKREAEGQAADIGRF